MQLKTKNNWEGHIYSSNSSKDMFKLELTLLLEAIYQRYGYDFREYSKTHLKRRILHRLNISEIETVSQLQDKVLRDQQFFSELLQDLSINITEMFRDPIFYKQFREKLVPVLSTYPFIKIWIAGCSTGEEVYSLAILLHELDLLKRTQIYATDFNRNVLEKARQGIYSSSEINVYAENYKESGGLHQLSDYYTSKYGSVIIDKALRKNIVFADHNLVTDSDFSEMNVILCRNVLIYFEKELQNKVLKLFHSSLLNKGFLCLGTKESIKFSDLENSFRTISKSMKIYRKELIIKNV